MTREEQIKEYISTFIEQYAESVDCHPKEVEHLGNFIRIGINWADRHPKDEVKWQTGEPIESGAYLVTIKGRYSIFVQYAQFGCLTGWSYFKPEEIIAWCKLSDIKPYKEETK